MYKLPDGIDLTFFTGLMLVQVCIGSHDIILHFENHVSLSIQADIAHLNDRGNITAIYKLPPTASATLAQFLHQKVTDATAINSSTLRLRFSNGDSLEVYDSSSQYESYQIRHGDELIVV